MQKVYSERFDETYYEEVLDNGLRVVLFEKPGFDKSSFVLATPYGGMDYQQKDDRGNILTYPKGVAHFLEHKMFEKEGKDVLDEFASMGANVNAFTSYYETAYYFSASGDIEKPLNLLLDFVQDLQITPASVEKEKGIIIQELEMYNQMPDSRLISEALKDTFERHPLKDDIGGTNDSVKAITYDDLMECYQNNYHPSKMLLVGVTGQDIDEVFNIIKTNQKAKTFNNVSKVERIIYDEPLAIKEHEDSFEMDVTIPKVCKVYKLEGCSDLREANRLEWCFKILFDAYFSNLNDEYQSWLDAGIISDDFSFEIDLGIDYGMIIFTSETKLHKAFFALIDQVIDNITSLDHEVITSLKKAYFGRNVKQLNSFDNIMFDYMRNYFSGIDYFDSLEVVESIDDREILNALERLDTKNCLNLLLDSKN